MDGSVWEDDLVGLSRGREVEESVCKGGTGQMEYGLSIPRLSLKMGACPGEDGAPSSPGNPIIEETASDANTNPTYFDG